MRLPHSALVLLTAWATVPAAAGGAPTLGLCAAQETTFFACPAARGRWIGLCGASTTGLQYRFGRAGAVELQFPDSPAAGVDRMLFAHYSRYRTDRVEVRFENQGNEYLVFDYREEGRRHAGVRVTTADVKEREITCTGRVTSRLVELKSLLKCDADSALNGGKCP